MARIPGPDPFNTITIRLATNSSLHGAGVFAGAVEGETNPSSTVEEDVATRLTPFREEYPENLRVVGVNGDETHKKVVGKQRESGLQRRRLFRRMGDRS